MMVWAIGRMPPPPSPCSARAAISAHMRGRDGAGNRPDDEDRDADQEDGAPAVDVGELAEQRRHRGGAQQVGGDDPGQALDVAEMDADGRQRRRDDRLLERAQEHGEHDPDDDLRDRGGREWRGPRHRVSSARHRRAGFRRPGCSGDVGAGDVGAKGGRIRHHVSRFRNRQAVRGDEMEAGRHDMPPRRRLFNGRTGAGAMTE